MAFALRHSSRRQVGPPASRNTVRDNTVRDERVAAEGAPTRPSRARVAAARGAWALGSILLAIARIVRLLVSLLVLLIVVAIVLRVVGANSGNTIVRDIHDAASAIVGPFKNVFSMRQPKLAIAVNWGLAAVVYAVVGGLIVRLITRSAPRGVPPAQTVA